MLVKKMPILSHFRQPEFYSVSLRDFAKQNRGNLIKNRKIFYQRRQAL
ncbi:MAG: hypothetical protein IJV35_03335 [Neisseriaceae bacterium]|nr:hypothetical protein [Neisseriaceae bacterium]